MDRTTQPSRPAPQFDLTGAPCITADNIEALIRAVFPAGRDRSSALSRFGQIERRLDRGDQANAQHLALQLIEFLVKKYHDGRMIGGTSPATAASTAALINGLLCAVGLTPSFDPGSLGADGAAALIYPTTPDTTVVTGTQWAGVVVPGASVTQPTLVTITRLPDIPGPLLTELDQYPIFYEFAAFPSSSFAQDLTVGTCIATSAAPPDLSRLRLAHNVPEPTPTGIEILPLAAAPFLNCTDADVAMAPRAWWQSGLARGADLLDDAFGLLAPRPLQAAVMFGAGLGGTVRTFSPFGAVDPLGVMTFAAPEEQHAPWGGTVPVPPAVWVRTPTGQPMSGVPVQFAIVAGLGSVVGGSTETDANGLAAVTSWTLGGELKCNKLRATATAPVGAGIAGSPLTFFGCQTER